MARELTKAEKGVLGFFGGLAAFLGIRHIVKGKIPPGWSPLDYDFDGDGIISKMEALQALADYFDDLITKKQALQVLALYHGHPVTCVDGETKNDAAGNPMVCENGEWVPVASPEEYICPVCGQPFSSSEAREEHFLASHATSPVNMLFKVSVWIGKWMTVWENGQQVLVPTYTFGQVGKVGITAYYLSSAGQRVERKVTYPDGSTAVGYTAGWQGPRCCYQDQKYCYTYSLPGFKPNQPGVYYGNIRICGSQIPGSGYETIDEINLILLKLI